MLITINTGNAAFADENKGAEIARILRQIAERMEECNGDYNNTLRDSNGNIVGAVKGK